MSDALANNRSSETRRDLGLFGLRAVPPLDDTEVSEALASSLSSETRRDPLGLRAVPPPEDSELSEAPAKSLSSETDEPASANASTARSNASLAFDSLACSS